MLLRYSFVPRLRYCALATAGSFMTIGLSINGCSLSIKPVWRGKTRLTSPEVQAAATSKTWRESDRATFSPSHSWRQRKPLLAGWVRLTFSKRSLRFEICWVHTEWNEYKTTKISLLLKNSLRLCSIVLNKVEKVVHTFSTFREQKKFREDFDTKLKVTLFSTSQRSAEGFRLNHRRALNVVFVLFCVFTFRLIHGVHGEFAAKNALLGQNSERGQLRFLRGAAVETARYLG